MIEGFLLEYGILGAWTFFNLYFIKYLIEKLDKKDAQELEREKEFIQIIRNNTIALTKVYETNKQCEKIKYFK